MVEVSRFEIVVVGGGIMGAPAARAISDRGRSVAVVASPEPADPFTHRGPFGAYYDVSRLTWEFHADPVETELSRRSRRLMTDRHRQAGGIIIGIGSLFVTAPGRDEGRLAAVEKDGQRILDQLDIHRLYPMLRFPDDVAGFDDPLSPGLMNPRASVAADLDSAKATGAVVIPAAVRNIEVAQKVTIELDNGRRLEADRALVATGAFSNRAGLLPHRLALRIKSESVLLARLEAGAAAALDGYPPLVYQLDSKSIGDVYSSPPVAYPDGAIRLKWGANTLHDTWLEDPAEIGEWYRHGDSKPAGEDIRPLMESTIPGLRASSYETARCAVTYTAHGKPYIDEVVDGRLFVAIGGNGHSAKWSPVLGEMAADLVTDTDWDVDVPRNAFAAVFEGEEEGWAIRDLMSQRVGS